MKKNTLIRNWYQKKYPSDDMGQEINPLLTFDDILYVFQQPDRNIYDALAVHDSLIRERVFTGLAEYTGYSYDNIYNAWIHHANIHDIICGGNVYKR